MASVVVLLFVMLVVGVMSWWVKDVADRVTELEQQSLREHVERVRLELEDEC
jgi:hypothetical protein